MPMFGLPLDDEKRSWVPRRLLYDTRLATLELVDTL